MFMKVSVLEQSLPGVGFPTGWWTKDRLSVGSSLSITTYRSFLLFWSVFPEKNPLTASYSWLPYSMKQVGIGATRSRLLCGIFSMAPLHLTTPIVCGGRISLIWLLPRASLSSFAWEGEELPELLVRGGNLEVQLILKQTSNQSSYLKTSLSQIFRVSWCLQSVELVVNQQRWIYVPLRICTHLSSLHVLIQMRLAHLLFGLQNLWTPVNNCHL